MNHSLLTYGFGKFDSPYQGHLVLHGFGLLYLPVIQLNFALSIQQESLFSLER